MHESIFFLGSNPLKPGLRLPRRFSFSSTYLFIFKVYKNRHEWSGLFPAIRKEEKRQKSLAIEVKLKRMIDGADHNGCGLWELV
jgi:hypothetical protein